jgi:divalent metal cation (Fe/Co/Zn/Cd) transporter
VGDGGDVFYDSDFQADGLESACDFVAIGSAMIALRIGRKPYDRQHPYGHGKLEYFSAAFEGGLIFFAAIAIIFQAVKSFFVTNEQLNVFNGNIYLILN